MGVDVTMVDSKGQKAANIPDPAGGFFDAAGDFDRLIGQPGDWLVWSSIDEYGLTRFSSVEAGVLVTDLDQLLALAKAGSERRGLARLATMARNCAADPGALLVFQGD